MVKPKEKKRMTIAAGFVNDNGVLLAADTMTSDGGANTIFRSKIFPIHCEDSRVYLAFSGTATFADSFFHRCRDVLNRYSGAPRTMAEIAETIRKRWIQDFRDTHDTKGTYSADQVVCAIFSSDEQKTGLFYSSNQWFSESPTGVECIGAGDSLARYLTSWMPVSSLSRVDPAHVMEIAVNAMGRVKAFMPASVGGNLTAVQLNHDGSCDIYSETHIKRIEKYTAKFDAAVRLALIQFMDLKSDHPFSIAADRLANSLKKLHNEWESEADNEFIGLRHQAPQEIVDAFKDVDL
jgi:hypothetical protein